MDTGYRISELARRSGFSPSTLRYYETVGLLPDPDRTDSGYRLYDDDDVERMRFVARAKAMGLTLADIAELVALWADGPCDSARDRLRHLLEAKAEDVRVRIADLSTFAVQLDHLLRTLESTSSADRCGPGCACDAALPTLAAAPVGRVGPVGPVDPDGPVGRAGPVDSFGPSGPVGVVGCSLPAAAVADRTAQWAEVVAHATERRPTADGLRLRLPADPSIVARAAELAVLEVGCCTFFAFALRVDAAGVWLDVAAPADARPLLDAILHPGRDENGA
jgi:DNA-binding transcriptional MerR regulator